jgi:hypothetical protein
VRRSGRGPRGWKRRRRGCGWTPATHTRSGASGGISAQTRAAARSTAATPTQSTWTSRPFAPPSLPCNHPPPPTPHPDAQPHLPPHCCKYDLFTVHGPTPSRPPHPCTRQVCGVCRSRLEVLSGPARAPATPKAGGTGEDGGRTPLNGFAAFVKVCCAKRGSGDGSVRGTLFLEAPRANTPRPLKGG